MSADPSHDRGVPAENNSSSNKDEGYPSQDDASMEGASLYINGLTRTAKHEDVHELFSKYGKAAPNCFVTRVQVVCDPHTKEARGFGFVSMSTAAEADQAIAGLNGTDFCGRVLGVERAKRDKPRSPTPGRYYGPQAHRDYYGRRNDYDPRGYSRRPYDRRPPPRGGYVSDRRERGVDRYDRSDRYESRNDRYEPSAVGRGGSYGGGGYAQPPGYYPDRDRDYRSYDSRSGPSSSYYPPAPVRDYDRSYPEPSRYDPYPPPAAPSAYSMPPAGGPPPFDRRFPPSRPRSPPRY